MDKKRVSYLRLIIVAAVALLVIGYFLIFVFNKTKNENEHSGAGDIETSPLSCGLQQTENCDDGICGKGYYCAINDTKCGCFRNESYWENFIISNEENAGGDSGEEEGEDGGGLGDGTSDAGDTEGTAGLVGDKGDGDDGEKDLPSSEGGEEINPTTIAKLPFAAGLAIKEMGKQIFDNLYFIIFILLCVISIIIALRAKKRR